MPIELIGLLEDVDCYNGKNGFGANITISSKHEKKTKRITFMIKDENLAKKFESLLDTDIVVKIELNENKFGLRLGEVIEIGA